MKPIIFHGVPRCATDMQFLEWIRAARQCNPGPLGFCADCSPTYAKLMRQVRRCEQPHVTFDARGEPVCDAKKSAE